MFSSGEKKAGGCGDNLIKIKIRGEKVNDRHPGMRETEKEEGNGIAPLPESSKHNSTTGEGAKK